MYTTPVIYAIPKAGLTAKIDPCQPTHPPYHYRPQLAHRIHGRLYPPVSGYQWHQPRPPGYYDHRLQSGIAHPYRTYERLTQMEKETLVIVEHVAKKFCRDLKTSLWYGMKDLGSEFLAHKPNDDIQLRPKEFWAVKDINFELKRGECLGLIGRNGAGKSTLLKILNGLIKPDKGRIEMRGRIGALIELGSGFNPILTGRENIYNNGSVLGLNKKEIDAVLDEIIDFSEIEKFIDTPVQYYSSGMKVRLGFSVAAHMKPDVLILDEVLAVGDSGFKIKSFNKINSIMREVGRNLREPLHAPYRQYHQ